MLTSIHYVIRSSKDGKYLAARVSRDRDTPEVSYLLLFKADHEALSYLNTHGRGLSDRAKVESISPTQLKSLLQRWGYQGIGLVEDPLIPNVNFLEI